MFIVQDMQKRLQGLELAYEKITKVIQDSRCNLPDSLMKSEQPTPTGHGQKKTTSDEGVNKPVDHAKELDNPDQPYSFVVNVSDGDDEIVFGEGFYNTPSLVTDTEHSPYSRKTCPGLNKIKKKNDNLISRSAKTVHERRPSKAKVAQISTLDSG